VEVLKIATEDMYIEELDLHIKRGDLINTEAIDYNLNNDKKLYTDLRPTYHLVIYVIKDLNLVRKNDSRDLSLLIQLFDMQRIKSLIEKTDMGIMKTVMELSVISYAVNPPEPIVKNLINDLKGD